MPKTSDDVVYVGSDPILIVRDIPRGASQRAAIEAAIAQAGIPWPPLPGPDSAVSWRAKTRVSQHDWARASRYMHSLFPEA